MMPPKILISTAFTFGRTAEYGSILDLLGDCAAADVEEVAGLPPASLMMSMVAMASPAPFTMQATLPSSLM